MVSNLFYRERCSLILKLKYIITQLLSCVQVQRLPVFLEDVLICLRPVMEIWTVVTEVMSKTAVGGKRTVSLFI